MGIISTGFKDLYVFEPRVFEDDRGCFLESFNKKIWKEVGLDLDFVQDNESLSRKGVLRGLHYQFAPMGQAKLVRVTNGTIIDVVLDLRKEEPTYGQSYKVKLSAENKRQLFIPRGFAHGFMCLTDDVIFTYKCDNYYSKEHEASIHPLDPQLNIDWEMDHKDIILSEKDTLSPLFGQHKDY